MWGPGNRGKRREAVVNCQTPGERRWEAVEVKCEKKAAKHPVVLQKQFLLPFENLFLISKLNL